MNKTSELKVAERYRGSGDLDRAVAALRALVSEIPDDTGIRRRLADVLIESGNRDSAISELVKIQERLASAGDILGAIAAGLTEQSSSRSRNMSSKSYCATILT